LTGCITKSAGPKRGELLSVIAGMGISTQMGLATSALIKLQSFLVAADVACSSGDLPVVAVEARLVAVTGFATATVATVVPAELAAALPDAPTAARGATQPCRQNKLKTRKRLSPVCSWC